MPDHDDSTPPESKDVRAFDPFSIALLDEGARFNLILVRHGQQAERREHDSPLSDIGRKQAQAVADHLAGEHITAVFSSQLERANHTGIAIAERHGLECVVDERLEEIHIGRDVPDGKKLSDLLPEDELKERAKKFIATRRWDTFAMSETGAELRARVWPALNDIRASDHEGSVVIACHGGVINAIIGQELGVEMDYFFKVAHASVHRLRVGDDRLVIEAINETPHLQGELFTY